MKKLLLSCVLFFSVMLIPAQDLEITQLTNYLAGNHHIVGILRKQACGMCLSVLLGMMKTG